jgi:hypothetical protein
MRLVLLQDAEAWLRGYVRNGKEEAAVALFYQIVYERTGAMHQRAQDAESESYRLRKQVQRLERMVMDDSIKAG